VFKNNDQIPNIVKLAVIALRMQVSRSYVNAYLALKNLLEANAGTQIYTFILMIFENNKKKM
jgi:hypothetical protein